MPWSSYRSIPMKSVLWMRACNHESGQETPRVKPFVYNYNGLPCYEQSLCQALNADSGRVEIRQFPDGETYVRVLDTQVPATAIVLADLHAPDAKFLPLAFLAECLRELGAKTIILVTPYLPYMRQDIRFHPGEGIPRATLPSWFPVCSTGWSPWIRIYTVITASTKSMAFHRGWLMPMTWWLNGLPPMCPRLSSSGLTKRVSSGREKPPCG